MEQNKTGKYFKYAIGEIVLVVIGILIALSINNWNEDKKESIQEVKILNQLKSDIIDDLKEVKIIKSSIHFRLRCSDSIMVYFDEKRKVDDSLLKYFNGIRGISIFNNANTTYKYIQSSGLNTLSNDSLRSFITKMYETFFRNIHERSTVEAEIRDNVLKPFMRKHFRPDVLPDLVSAIKGKTVLRSYIHPINIVTLRENLEFQNILLELKHHLRVRKKFLKITLKELDKLLVDIQNEIERLENR